MPRRAGARPEPQLPPPERGRHDPVQVVDARDPDGWPVTHARALDNIGRLLRDGAIEEGWAGAGYLFRRDFLRAQLDPLRAADMSRASGGTPPQAPGERVEQARDRVARIMARLGGPGSPLGSVAWHVVGAEMPIADWTRRQRWGGGAVLNPHRATGLLIGALSTLAVIYRTGARAPGQA